MNHSDFRDRLKVAPGGMHVQMKNDLTLRTEHDKIKVGDTVYYRESSWLGYRAALFPAIVLALDTDPAWDAGERDNPPAAWVRHTTSDGSYRYRSVDVCDLVLSSGKTAG